jgi:SAM-dependent methyltransferase
MTAEIPIPPADLTARLSQSPRSWAERARYLDGGRQSRQAIERVLPDDWTWPGKSVLDFGCGAGRTIRHFIELAPGCRLWGSDISAPCIDWDLRHLSPPVEFVLHSEVPPLPFPDGTFDLIYAMSVFTHISEHWASWLLELDRILAPGGRLMVTFMGEGMCRAVTGEEWDEARVGMNVYEAGQSWELGGPMVLHSPWWIEAHWGRLFEIERLEPRSFFEREVEFPQDDHGVVVLRKTPARAPTAGELKWLDPAEPREANALHHDVLHLRAEVASLRAPAPIRPRRRLRARWGAVRRRLNG